MQHDVSELEKNAEKIVLYVGGASNITGISSGTHSLLSISVKHMEYVKKLALQKMWFIDEVFFNANEVVILIQHTPAHEVELAIRLCDETADYIVTETSEKNESNLEKAFAYSQAIFMPILPVLIAGGILQAIVILIYNVEFLSVYTSNQPALTTLSGTVYNFLPIMIAFSSAKHHKTNPYIAITIASILMHPLITSFISDIILEQFLGFRLLSETYSNSILPILMIVPIIAYIDHQLKNKMSSSIRLIVKPFVLLIVGLSLGVFLFRPWMTLIGNLIVALIEMLLQLTPWIVPTVLGLFGPIMVMTGAHYSLFDLITAHIQSMGFDRILGPAMLAANFSHVGVALAVALKAKNSHFRNYSFTSFIMTLFGVSQPTIFGIEIVLKRPFLYAMIGGGVGGLLAGILELKSYSLENPSFVSLLSFQDEGNNFLIAWIVLLTSFTVSFVLTWRDSFIEPTDKEFHLSSTYPE